MALPDVFSNPLALGALTALIVLAVHYQRGLSWREYRTIHRLKQLTFPILQRRSPGGFDSFVNEKGGKDDGEYLVTLNGSLREVTRMLLDGGGSLHLISSVKRRTTDGALSDAHVVWFHSDGSQTEAYMYDDGGKVSIYAHHEASVTTPMEHIEDTNQHNGDPRGVVAEAITNAR